MSNYYKHFCGGEFYVDLSKQPLNIAPSLYFYICDTCGKTKLMACLEEQNELFKGEMDRFEREGYVKRSYKLAS